jgi:hypothetical protein
MQRFGWATLFATLTLLLTGTALSQSDCGSWSLPEMNDHLGADALSAPSLPAAPPSQVGDRLTFFVHIPEGRVRATLRHVGKRATYWVAESEADVVTDAAIRSLADEFDRVIYPTVHAWFGSEWFPGVDGDGRLTILFHDIENNASAAGFGGYFSPTDEIPRLPTSNVREVLYLDAYAIRDYERFRFLSLVAHEFTHIVNWRQRGGRTDQRWLEEGRASFAEWAVYGNIHVDFVNNYLADTTVSLTAGNNFQTWYGGGFLFALYCYDRFGRAFIESFYREPERGFRAVEATLKRLGRSETLEDVVRGWTLANLVNDRNANPLAGYASLRADFRVPSSRVTRLSGVPVQTSVDLQEWSAVYIEFGSLPRDASFRVAGQAGRPLLASFWRPSTGELLPVRAGDDGTARRALRGVAGESVTLILTSPEPQTVDVSATTDALADGTLETGALTTTLPLSFSLRTSPIARSVVEGKLKEEAFLPTTGEAYGVAVRGNDLWATAGWGTLRFDRSDPSRPHLVAAYPSSGLAQDVLAAETYIAVAQGRGGVLVLDPRSGERRASVTSGGDAIRLARFDKWLFVLNADTGLRVFDLSDPSNPRLANQLFGGAGADLMVEGGNLYLSDGTGLGVYTLDALPTLRRTGLVRVAVTGIAPDANVLWVGSGQLYGFDANNLVVDPFVSHATVGAPRSLIRTGRLLVVAEGEGGLSLVDIGVQRSPRTLARALLPGEPNALAMDGRWVYAACGTALTAVDIADPSRPAVTWTMRLDGDGDRLVIADGTAYVALGEGGVVVAEVANASRAMLTGRMGTRSLARSVSVAHGTGVVGTERGAEVWDVRGQPRLVGSFDTAVAVLDVALSEDGTVAYLASGGVQAVEVETGRALGRWEGTAVASALSLRGNRLAVAALEEGVFVLDVSNPASPVEVRRFPTNGSARTVGYDGDTLYAGVGDTILAFDGTQEVGRWNAGFDLRSLAAKGGFVFAGGETTLAGWDARDLTNPALLSRVRGLEWVGGVALVGDKVVLSDHFGVRIYRRSDSGAPLAVMTEVPKPNDVAEPAVSPFVNRLGRNYPNPLNPETWIPFELAKPSRVELVVYDARGNRVRTLRLGWLEAGRYERQESAAHWDGLNESGEPVAGGIYFVELRVAPSDGSGEIRFVRRMGLAR